MLFMVRPDTKSVHHLADLLETIEVTADELMDLRFAAHDLAAIRVMNDIQIEAQLAALRAFVARVRELEMSVVAKLTQAREKARAAARADWRLRPIMMLFTSGTQAFADHFEAEADPAEQAFHGANQIFPYLRSRGLVSPLTTHYDGTAELLVTDSFRLLGAMPLRDLLERVEATLNAVDAHYDLYDLENDEAEEAAVAIVSETNALVAEAAEKPVEAVAVVAIAPGPGVPVAINFGEELATETAATAATVLTPLASADGAPLSADGEVKPAEPAAAEIAAAHDASEAGLKGLTARLAEMKAEEPAFEKPAETATAA
jgi:hypothetical protein